MKTEKHENTVETRNQTLAKILFFLPKLTDQQLRMVAGVIRGLIEKT